MPKAQETIVQAQAVIGSDLEFDRLDQVFNLQRLLGPVIAYKKLLEIAINGRDPKEQRLAAAKLLDAVDEPAEQVADRLRASIFSELSLDELQAVVQTGITDPEKAVERLKEAS